MNTWEGTTVPRKAYSTYIFGKDANISIALPNGIVEKKKMKKLTVRYLQKDCLSMN